MQSQWKNLSFMLSAMIVGSFVTTLVLSVPEVLRDHAMAQEAAQRNGQFNQANALDAGRTPIVNQRELAQAEGLSNAFRNVAEAIRPCVVSISTVQTEVIRRGLPPGIPPQFRDLFGSTVQELERSGMGSGVIVRPDGYILTNNHVIEDADTLTVELYDGRKVSGSVVGTDPQTDLAVVKIDVPGLQAATFGQSDNVRVGDWVVAIGSPFGLDQTVTAGIISGKNRVQGIIADGEGFEDFLQTDAAINPGNSGGALVNLRGELIGINTAILSRSGTSAGIGFAIPVTLSKPVLDSIVETGEVKRGLLGAQVVSVTPELVREYDLKARKGALVGVVFEGQAADRAGMQPGDIVLSLDGKPCTSDVQLRNYVASRRPGSVVRMEVNRDGRKLNVRVTLDERREIAMFDAAGGQFGAKLVPVTPRTAREYGYVNLRSGLIVSSVKEGTPAEQAKLDVGDVIIEAEGYRLQTIEQLAKVYDGVRKEDRPLRMIVLRGNTRMLLVLE
ncbi:MAG: Do family serine endopeptidase [Planctomycetota bacterium]